MAKKTSEYFISKSNDFICAISTKEKFRVDKHDFTRNRKLPFNALVLCMLKLLRRSLSLELNSFFRDITSSAKRITVSAFVQSRKKIKADLFYELNQLISKEYFLDNDENIDLYKGLRVLSIDGSTIHLPLSKELKIKYGTFNNQKKTDDVIIARVSILYDVLNNIVLDGLLRPFSEGEIPLAKEHFRHAKKGDLIIMDRAYPSFKSAYLMQQEGIDFLIRCKESFSNQVKSFVESGKTQDIILLKPKQNKSFKDLPYDKDCTLTVRMLKIILPSGETEIVMTSLLDTTMHSYNDFKELYFKRWKVETFYDRFKNIIGIECFSGTSEQLIQQEFNCALYISNLQTILTQEAQYKADKKYENRTYQYTINRSLSLGIIREKIILLFTRKNETKKILDEMNEFFVLNVIPIRPGRKYKRDVGKYRKRTKPKQFSNRRIVC